MVKESPNTVKKVAFSITYYLRYLAEKSLKLKDVFAMSVRRHIVGGENRTLISVETPLRLCRTGTCRKLSAERPQIVVALFERQLVLLLK